MEKRASEIFRDTNGEILYQPKTMYFDKKPIMIKLITVEIMGNKTKIGMTEVLFVQNERAKRYFTTVHRFKGWNCF